MSSYSHVYITSLSSSLAQEISRQLSQYKHIKVFSGFDFLSALEVQPPDAIIHFATVSPKSYRLTHTSSLLLTSMLDYCHLHDTKLIVLLSNVPTPFSQTVVSTITKFAHSKSLNFHIFETDPNVAEADYAESLLKKIVFRHKANRQIKLKPEVKPHRLSFKKICISMFVTIFTLVVFQYLLIFSFVACTIVSLSKSLQTTTRVCSSLSSVVSNGPVPLTLQKSVKSLSLFAQEISAAQLLLSQYLLTATQPKELSTALVRSLVSLSSLQSSLSGLYVTYPLMSDYLSKSALQLTDIHDSLANIYKIVSDVTQPTIPSSPIMVMIVVQDSTELRSVGGFIDNVIFATIADNRVADIQVKSISSASDQTPGHVEPPEALRLYAGQNEWNFHDASWDPDFPTAANRLVWFAQKEFSLHPDYVIAVNTQSLARLLTAIGPITLNSSLKVSDATLFDTYLKYLNSATQSETVLYMLSQKLVEKYQTLDVQHMYSIVPWLSHELNTRQILVAAPSISTPGLQSSTWSGAISLPVCNSGSLCLQDYLYVVDTNLSLNKSSIAITREFITQSVLTPQGLSTTHKLTYSNSSPRNAWPLGTMKNFLRIYLPPRVQLDTVKIGDLPLAYNQYSLSREHGLQLLSLFVETPPGDTTVTLTVHQQIQLTGRVHFQALVPNQPGSPKTSYTYNIAYPPSWFVTAYKSAMVASPGRLMYNAIHFDKPTTVTLDILPR
jgi:hypothetical protein